MTPLNLQVTERRRGLSWMCPPAKASAGVTDGSKAGAYIKQNNKINDGTVEIRNRNRQWTGTNVW